MTAPTTGSVAITERPIFIIGAPRSGTSMMQWALREHSALWGGPESDFMVPLLSSFKEAHAYGSRRGKFHWLSRLEVDVDEFLQHMGHGVNALYTHRSGGLRWVEQTPLYTLYVEEIATMFPEAQFIWMLRDGRQVAHSLMHFEANQQELEQGSETWRRYTQAAFDFRESDRGDRVFTMPFAELVTEPEPQIERLCDFLGVAREDGPAQLIRKRKLNSSFGADEAGARKRDGWKEWASPEREVFAKTAGQIMDQLFPEWSTS